MDGLAVLVCATGTGSDNTKRVAKTKTSRIH
jgi:hypothetical protein